MAAMVRSTMAPASSTPRRPCTDLTALESADEYTSTGPAATSGAAHASASAATSYTRCNAQGVNGQRRPARLR
jgi:hypothetical protein